MPDEILDTVDVSANEGEADTARQTPTAPTGIEADIEAPEAETAAPKVSLLADPYSAMTPRFNLLVRWFANRFFGHFELGAESVARLKELEKRGSIVYVMRYSSRLDYLLFNTLFLRDGLRLSSFANGIRFYLYQPLWQVLRKLLLRKRGRSRAVEHLEDQQYVRRLTDDRESLFLFMRTKRLGTFWRGLWRMRHRHDEIDLLQEVVRESWNGDHEVFVVPLSLFWRKGPRNENRFLNLDYGSLSRPSDIAKVSSFLATYRSLSVKIGEPIDLMSFIRTHRDAGQERVTRIVRRSILIYLYREEKVVEGPTLRSPQRVLEEILSDAGVQAAMKERADHKRGTPLKAEREVENMTREIAARMNSTLLAVLSAVVGAVVRRLFSNIETQGLDKVAEYAKRHPIVLVPTHRSYFDFLILSLLFYANYLVPPHIAARDNMGFGPFGLIFRMAGAFYLRKSFDDPLYKQVFRAYVAYLVREGFTQEFFIEGGRSRTGKSLAPRLGMLGWDVDAFLECTRNDLFFVPIAITYERLVEESVMVDELEGGKKTKESTLALFRARKYLRSRFGSVHVNFGEPISLDEALGERRERFERQMRGDVRSILPLGSDEEVEALDETILDEKRQFVDALGHRIVERINWSVVANATSVGAAVMMGVPHRGLVRGELVQRMQQIVDLLRLQNVRLTAALRSDQGAYDESIAFLIRSDLLKSIDDPPHEILYFEESRRRALDIYRNSIVHYLATPSFLARKLLRGATAKELREDLESWQEILYQEFFVPREEGLTLDAVDFIDHFEAVGWIERGLEQLHTTREGEGILRCLEAQTQGVIECYEVACRVLLAADGEITKKAFLERAAESFENAKLLGRAARSEAANDTTFGNLLDLLLRRRILESTRIEKKGGASELTFAPGEGWPALAELRERLAAAVTGD
jgi:glycerol-3-phosphate O-acyltransferase